MEVIPAIDLKDGRCVRLYQGDFARESVYSDDPAAVARRWEEEGAVRLHVVDLDGAAEGRPRNAPLIEGIVKAVEMPVQVGGGIRSLQTLAEYLEMGVQRVVLGTSAVEDADLVEEACRRYGEAVVIGVDARDGYVATSGWTRGTRPLEKRALALVRFVCLGTPAGSTWRERRGAWNKAHPAWNYPEVRAFERDFRRAERQLSGQRYGLEWFYEPGARLDLPELVRLRAKGDRQAARISRRQLRTMGRAMESIRQALERRQRQ